MEGEREPLANVLTVQLPLFLLSYTLTRAHLHYKVPFSSLPTSRRSLLSRIDYLGTLLLLLTVSSSLFFLSQASSLSFSWNDSNVWGSLVIATIAAIAFLWTELRIAIEPVLDPRLLSKKISILVGISSFLMSMSNLAIICEFPLFNLIPLDAEPSQVDNFTSNRLPTPMV